MSTVLYRSRLGASKADISVEQGATIPGGNAVEVNFDFTTMGRREAVLLLRQIRAQIVAGQWPAVAGELLLRELTWTPSGTPIRPDSPPGTVIGSYSGLSAGGALGLSGADFDAGRLAVSGNQVVVGAASLSAVSSLTWTPFETNGDAGNSPRESAQRSVGMAPAFTAPPTFPATLRVGVQAVGTPGTVTGTEPMNHDLELWRADTEAGPWAKAQDGLTRTPVADDEGKVFRPRHIATNAFGSADETGTISDPVLPEDVAALNISGTPDPIVDDTVWTWSPVITGGTEPYALSIELDEGSPSLADGGIEYDGDTGTFYRPVGDLAANMTIGMTIHVTDDDEGSASLHVTLALTKSTAFRLLPQASVPTAWTGLAYTYTPIVQNIPAGSAMTDIVWEWVDGVDLADFGATFNDLAGTTNNGRIRSTGVLNGGGAITGAIRATVDGQVATLPVSIEVSPPLEQFADFMSNTTGANILMNGRVSPDSGHTWSASGGTVVLNADGKIAFGNQPGSAYVTDYTPASDSYEVLVEFAHGWAGSVAGMRVGAIINDVPGVGSYRMIWEEPDRHLRLVRTVSGGSTTDLVTPIPMEWGNSQRRFLILQIDRSVPGEATLNVQEVTVGRTTLLTATDTDPWPVSHRFGVAQLAAVGGTHNGRLLPMRVQGGVINEIFVPAGNTTYYVDYENGDDANNGLTELTPWKHAPRFPGATGFAKLYPPMPGDTILFKGGVEYKGAITSFPGHNEEAPSIVYDGESWGEERAAIRRGDEVFGTPALRKPVNQADAGGSALWEHPDFYILEHPNVRADRPVVIYDNVGGVNQWPACPVTMNFWDQEDNATYRDGENLPKFMYVHEDFPDRVFSADPAFVKITDAALADKLRGSEGTAARVQTRYGPNLLTFRTFSVDGDTITINGSDGKYDDPTSEHAGGFIAQFVSIPSALEPGSACALEAGKAILMMRPGTTSLRIPKWGMLIHNNSAPFRGGNNVTVRGFTFQGFVGEGIIDFDGRVNPVVERCFISDCVNTSNNFYRKTLFSFNSTVGARSHENTYARCNNFETHRIFSADDWKVSRMASYLGLSSIINQNGGELRYPLVEMNGAYPGVTNGEISECIWSDGINLHKNPITFYCDIIKIDDPDNPGQKKTVFVRTDNIKIDRVCATNMGLMFKLRGAWSNFEVTNCLWQSIMAANGAFYQSDNPSPNKEGQPPIATGLAIDSSAFFSRNTPALRIMRNCHDVTVSNAIAHGGWSNGTIWPSPAGTGRSDYFSEWDLSDPVETGISWEQYLQLPGVDVDDRFNVTYRAKDGTLINVDLSNNPKEEAWG